MSRSLAYFLMLHIQDITHPELDGDGEVIASSLLVDGITAFDARKIDVTGLDDALLSLHCFDELLSEAEAGISH